MRPLTLEQVRENLMERISMLERERDDQIYAVIEKQRMGTDPSRCDLKPLIHALDKLRAEQALLDGMEMAEQRREEMLRAFQRESARNTAAAEAERLAYLERTRYQRAAEERRARENQAAHEAWVAALVERAKREREGNA